MLAAILLAAVARKSRSSPMLLKWESRARVIHRIKMAEEIVYADVFIL